jgi:hypothetical protein
MEILGAMVTNLRRGRWLDRLMALVCFVFSLAFCALGDDGASASGPAPGEYEIKAAFLFNFAKFVEWPPSALGPNDPIRIGIFGKDPFGPDLEKTIQGKKIGDHPVELERYTDKLPQNLPHVLFICASEKKNLSRILAQTMATSTLTVSEADGFCESGGIINFKRAERKVRFEINPKAGEHQKFKLSSKLMGVALRVVDSDSIE